MMQDTLIDRKQLARRFGVSESTLDRYRKLDEFPKPLPGLPRPRWSIRDIERFEMSSNVVKRNHLASPSPN